MESTVDYLNRIKNEAVLSVALLDALSAFIKHDRLYVQFGSKRLRLDFSEEIAALISALMLLNVDADKAMSDREDGMWL